MFNKKLAWILVGVVIVSLGFYFYKKNPLQGLPKAVNTATTNEHTVLGFQGNATEIATDHISLYGVYLTKEQLPPEQLKPKKFLVKISVSTKFKKVEVILPSLKDVKASGSKGIVTKISDMPTQESTSSQSDFQKAVASNPNGYFIEAYFKDSIYGQNEATADSISYKSFGRPNN